MPGVRLIANTSSNGVHYRCRINRPAIVTLRLSLPTKSGCTGIGFVAYEKYRSVAFVNELEFLLAAVPAVKADRLCERVGDLFVWVEDRGVENFHFTADGAI